MSEHDPQYNFPRDKETLLRDFTVANRLRDIRDEIELRQNLLPKWWETIIGVIQFAAALGLLTSVALYARAVDEPVVRQMAFWGTLTVLSLVFGYEFLILKLYHLRRANTLTLRHLETVEKRLAEMEKALVDRQQPSEADARNEDDNRGSGE